MENGSRPANVMTGGTLKRGLGVVVTLGGGTTETLKELVGKKMMSDFTIDGFLGMHTF